MLAKRNSDIFLLTIEWHQNSATSFAGIEMLLYRNNCLFFNWQHIFRSPKGWKAKVSRTTTLWFVLLYYYLLQPFWSVTCNASNNDNDFGALVWLQRRSPHLSKRLLLLLLRNKMETTFGLMIWIKTLIKDCTVFFQLNIFLASQYFT